MKYLLYTDFTFKKSVEISKESFDLIIKSKNNLSESVSIEQLFEFLVENYIDFELELSEAGTRYLISFLPDHNDFQHQYTKIVRSILNLLSTSRGYIDQSKRKVKNIANESEKIFEDFEKLFNDQYDNHLGYRVIEALRNYSQHCGYPIKSIIYHHQRAEISDENFHKIALTPYIDISDLRFDSRFKKSVLKELENDGPKIDIKPFIRRYIASLGEIHNGFRKLFFLQTKMWEEIVLSHIKMFKEKYSDEIIISLQVSEVDDNNVIQKSTYIYEDLVYYRRYLERKNSDITSVYSKYISGEIIRKVKK